MDLHSTDPTADARDRSTASRDRSAGEWREWDPADAPIAWMRKTTVAEARRVWSVPWGSRRRKDASILVRDCNLALHEGLIYSFVGESAPESTGSRTATTAATSTPTTATPNVATPSPSASAASILQVLAGQERISGGIVSVFGESPYGNARTMDSTVLAGVSVRYPAQWRADRVLRTAARRYPNWDDDYAEMVSRAFQLDLSTKVNHLSTQARTLLSAVVADCAAHPRTVVMNQADRRADKLVHASADRLLVVSGGTVVEDFPTDDA